MSDTDETTTDTSQTYKLERCDPPRGSAPLSFRANSFGDALDQAEWTIGKLVEYELDWEDSHLLISTANDDAWALTPCDLITELSTVDGWSGELIGAYLAEAYKEHGFEGIDTSSREEFAQWLAARANAALAAVGMSLAAVDPGSIPWIQGQADSEERAVMPIQVLPTRANLADGLLGATLKTHAGDVIHVEEVDDRVLGVPWLRCRVIESPSGGLGGAGMMIGVDPARAREWTRIEPTAPRAGYEVGDRVTTDGKAYVCTASDQPPAAAGAGLFRAGEPPPDPDTVDLVMELENQVAAATARADAAEADAKLGRGIIGAMRSFRAAACEVAIRDALGEYMPPEHFDSDGAGADALVAVILKKLESNAEFTPTAGREPPTADAAETAQKLDAADARSASGQRQVKVRFGAIPAAGRMVAIDADGFLMQVADDHPAPLGRLRGISFSAASPGAPMIATADIVPLSIEDLKETLAAVAGARELADREINRIRPRMERFELRAKELRSELDAIGEAIERHLSNDEHSNLERVARAGAERDAAAARAAAIVTEHLDVKLTDHPGPIGENLTRIEHGLIELKRRSEKAEAANERLRRERDRAREKAQSTGPTPSAMPRVKLTRAGGYDPATGLEKPARRGASVAVDVAVGARRPKHPGGKAASRATRRK